MARLRDRLQNHQFPGNGAGLIVFIDHFGNDFFDHVGLDRECRLVSEGVEPATNAGAVVPLSLVMDFGVLRIHFRQFPKGRVVFFDRTWDEAPFPGFCLESVARGPGGGLAPDLLPNAFALMPDVDPPDPRSRREFPDTSIHAVLSCHRVRSLIAISLVNRVGGERRPLHENVLISELSRILPCPVPPAQYGFPS